MKAVQSGAIWHRKQFNKRSQKWAWRHALCVIGFAGLTAALPTFELEVSTSSMS
jgi:hypothetical protein